MTNRQSDRQHYSLVLACGAGDFCQANIYFMKYQLTESPSIFEVVVNTLQHL
jgi:hypothetical protein